MTLFSAQCFFVFFDDNNTLLLGWKLSHFAFPAVS